MDGQRLARKAGSHRRFRDAALLGLLISLSASPALLAETLREEIREVYSVRDGGHVSVQNVNGSLEIESWDGDDVIMDATKEVSALGSAARQALEELRIDVDHDDSILDIRTIVPNDHGGLMSRLFGRRVQAKVSYRLRVPAGVSVEARTVNGDIHVDAVDGAVEALTTNGQIRISRAPASSKATTTNGSIRAELGDQTGIEGMTLRTTNGGIVVWAPPQMSCNLEASTVNGAVSSDFDIAGVRSSRTSYKRLEGELNGGGGTLSMRTVNGSIQLRRRATGI